ncbi:hypothetical protein C1H46_006423 [Malus baccata]|uniref:Reverse transcriptase Ty1/copia-type domain-containing protein n=1 Tax=Malus baccata TaxID=106549 RepID=A0A540NBL6_MALBA|nr:hypothetical protein C1H46_006423 [Malus baccata]
MKNSGTSFTPLLIYMDDIVVTGHVIVAIDSLKSYICTHFRIKYLGDLNYFLGIVVSRSKSSIYFSQRKYALEIMKDYGFLGARPIAFPMEDTILSDRLDITYLVHVLSGFMH